MRGNQFFGKPITPRAHKFNSKKNKQPVPVCLKVYDIGITEKRNIRRVHRATDLSIFRNRVQLRDILSLHQSISIFSLFTLYFRENTVLSLI